MQTTKHEMNDGSSNSSWESLGEPERSYLNLPLGTATVFRLSLPLYLSPVTSVCVCVCV